MKARFFGALAFFSLLLLCATAYADVLSASFDLNHDGQNESTADSTWTQEQSKRYKIEDEVHNGTQAGTFKFAWTPGPYSQNIGGMKTLTNRWTSWNKPNQSSNGSIVFTPTGNTDKTWGGTFTAQKWTLVPHAAVLNAPVTGDLIDGDAATGTSLVTCASVINATGPSGYLYRYSVFNHTSSPISFTWAGFSQNLNPGGSWATAVSSSGLAGAEVWDICTVTFNPGTQNAETDTFVAIYWTKPS